ncbi:hypothetical protein BDP55DRAFT_733038 [Colletotrichum godetiae]|uniref:Uncharacterized protein n=1 Tax=Colletotrichum godetiae TaxID=1209918 RepID=A0AAJ0ABZ9_9PEZI|nr:uncharacterized protein BDP55DRAFT_733038 [Colletotrichum godetiae]KAK1659723.1 hypothetical protein BDP55DRAFT_733038 [Colletotrichum godetiae]
MSSNAAQQGSAQSGASGRQPPQEGRAGAGAEDRLRDFEEDIDLELVSSERSGSHERQESRAQRVADAIARVDRLIPHGPGAAGEAAQPNDGQTKDLRGAGSRFSE